jgi:MFS family permease
MKEKTFQVGGRGATYVLIISSLLYLVNAMDRSVLAVVLEPMRLDLGLTDKQSGIIQTLFLASMVVFAFPVGFLVDRWSRTKTMALMAFFWSITTFITGLGKSFIGVLIPRTLTGTGEAGFASAGMSLISASYPEKDRAKKLGIFNACMLVGFVLGFGLGGVVAQKYGWRYAFFFFAIPGIILAIMALFMQDYKNIDKSQDATQGNFLASMLHVWKIPTIRWLYLGYGIAGFAANAFNVWAPTMLQRGLNYQTSQAGIVMGAVAFGAIIGPILGGVFADKLHAKRLNGRAIYGAFAQALGGVLTFLSFVIIIVLGSGSAEAIVGAQNNNTFIILGVLLMVLGQGILLSCHPGLAAVCQDVVEIQYRGLSIGLTVSCLYLFGGAWSPFIIGAVSDALGGGKAGLFYALSFSQLVGIIGLFVLLKCAKHYPADFKKVHPDYK